jgi:hypothetical protein
MIDIGKMTAQLKAEEEEVLAALREAANESAALEVLRRFDVYPLMRREAGIYAFAQARGWHSPEWADIPDLGIQEPPVDLLANPADSLKWWLESGQHAAFWPLFSFREWRHHKRTWEQWRVECREAWLQCTGFRHSWEYYAREVRKSKSGVSMKLRRQWDWEIACSKQGLVDGKIGGEPQFPPMTDSFRKEWDEKKAKELLETLQELEGKPSDAGELKPPTPAPQQAQPTPIVQVNGDYVTGDKVLGNKTEQIGIKGNNNTVGGSIDQHIGTQGKSAKKKFWTIKKIAAIVALLAGLATIAQWFQSHQSIKPPEEELSNPVLWNDGENSHD